MWLKKGFTVTELIVVVVIIGILAALALPGFRVTKERALDNEARSTLALIQAAEKIYKMEIGGYYASADRVSLNNNLRLSLPSPLSWNYAANASNTTAARVPSGRIWSLTFSGDTPSCSGDGTVSCP